MKTANAYSAQSIGPSIAKQAYAHCLRLAHSHYENFPVASKLIPAALRGPVAAIYAFARSADDIADEGDANAEQRLQQLQQYRDHLAHVGDGAKVDDPIFIAVAAASQQYDLPLQLFDDLLTAFMLDVSKQRYADFNEVLFYCRHSANPVGRLLLHIFDAASPENLRDSDAICSALQLINFLQDLEQDFIENNRIYIPQDDMHSFNIDTHAFAEHRHNDNMTALINKQIDRARSLMLQGAPLAWRLKGRFGLEIRLTVFGGLTILKKLQQQNDIFSRPRLGTTDKLHMVISALFRKCPVE